VQPYLLEVFPKTDRVTLLRFHGPGGLLGQRELDAAAVQSFLDEVERDYRQAAYGLQGLGRRLHDWLDGPTERWLQQARGAGQGLALHIDVAGRLRHLPWELLCQAGFLCGDLLRPFTPVRRVGRRGQPRPKANRPLRVLFMACAPEGVEPVLDFEAEERSLLEACRRHPVELVVEESGTLDGLREHVQAYGPGHFDVLHLTGHADVRDGTPCFLAEDPRGFPHAAAAEEVAEALAGHWPRLVFLSGCKTGQAAGQGAVPSLAEAVVAAGAPAVLGWALPVGDAAAGEAAAVLYDRLAVGRPADEAVALARQRLLEKLSPYWHLLRLYADATPLAEYVTPCGPPAASPCGSARRRRSSWTRGPRWGSAPG
jgi:CHAT domain-containing protein